MRFYTLAHPPMYNSWAARIMPPRAELNVTMAHVVDMTDIVLGAYIIHVWNSNVKYCDIVRVTKSEFFWLW